MKSKCDVTRRRLPRRSALAVALLVGLGVSGLAFGQATSGAVIGNAPAGDTVQIANEAGLSRTITVRSDGTYDAAGLPAGTYTVTLMKNGTTVSTRKNVNVVVGGGVAVNFAAPSAQNAQNLGAVEVSASALPSIDVTTVHDSTTITAAQLKQLPIARNARAIALLTPGTVAGSSFFGGSFFRSLSIGGASGSENAYYINGYNTGNLYRNIGGYSLPYGAIAQQQTLTGGFSAKYGRSDGGVISQTGKSGTNQWHFGAQVVWRPRSLEASPKSGYYPFQPLPTNLTYQNQPNTYHPGTLRQYRGDNKEWETTYTGYIGGPLIKDKLFIFLDAAVTKSRQTTIGSVAVPTQTNSTDHRTKFYGDLNWNINDNNILEATYFAQKGNNGSGVVNYYDYSTFSQTGFRNPSDQNHVDAKFYMLHYTSYITDNATLSILYGHGKVSNPVTYGVSSSVPIILGGGSQNSAYWGPNVNPAVGIINKQTNTALASPDSGLSSHGLRADFTYQLGTHKLGVGIDNMYYNAHDQGSFSPGGEAPAKIQALNPHGAPMNGNQWIYLPGNVVLWRNINSVGGMQTKQKAWYVQDQWQITPNFLLNIGVRNDHYINITGTGQTFVNQKNQWEPRLGASWDVFGDSSLKIYGNMGRYYLALPQNAANRAADRSTFVRQIWTYTGINPDGTPILDKPAPGWATVGSPDGEFGKVKDVKQVTASNLRPMFVDKFNLGFDAKLGSSWQYGAKLSYYKLGSTIDDECDGSAIATKLTSMGYNAAQFSDATSLCHLFNPGQTSDIVVARNAAVVQKDASLAGYVTVPMSFNDWGFPQKPKRTYKAINLYFSHPFDGKWYGRIDYTYTDAKGNTSGQVRPDFGQADVSKTEDWDFPSLMVGQYGELLNSRKNIFRIRGAYLLTPQWMFSATAMIASGTPQECLGYTGKDALGDPAGYNGGGTGNYHWCDGQIVHPGSDSKFAGHTPWTHVINLGVTYTPAFADHRLAFNMNVFNALDEQEPTQTQPSFVASPRVVSNIFHYPISFEPPRYVQFSVSYDY